MASEPLIFFFIFISISGEGGYVFPVTHEWKLFCNPTINFYSHSHFFIPLFEFWKILNLIYSHVTNVIHGNEIFYLETNTSNGSHFICSLTTAFPLVTGWMVIYKLYLCLWQQKRVLGHCRLQQIRSTNPPQM